MARLKVNLHGQTLTELDLVSGQEYFAGRGSQSDIILANERGISRQHIKFYEQDGVWTAVLISKYGGLILNDQAVNQIQLVGDIRFTVPPYEFLFHDHGKQVTSAPAFSGDLDSQNQDQSLAPEEKSLNFELNPNQTALQNKNGNFEATAIAVIHLEAFLRIVNTKTNSEETLKLEGNTWTIGRHPSSEVVIDDSAISRKHIDLIRTADGYFVHDLGSSNGTKVNGIRLESNQSQKLSSGDKITIRHLTIHFEIHDSRYQKNLAVLPPEPFEMTASIFDNDPSPQTSSALVPISFEPEPAAIVRKIEAKKHFMQKSAIKFNKLNPVQKALVVLSIILVIGFFLNTETTNQGSQDNSSTNSSTIPLNEEKRKEATDIFYIAKNHYLQRKYSLCIAQIEKLHAMVPFYENSKEIDSLCRQALELEKIEEDRRNKEEAKAEVENRIRQNVETCKRTFTSQTTYDEITVCLMPSIELDPQNLSVTELQTNARIQEEQKLAAQSKLDSLRERRSDGEALYNSAKRNFQAGRLKTALSQFNQFVRGQYPGLDQAEAEATRSIASIQKILSDKINSQISLCETALEKSDLRGALIACDNVLKENPGNEKATNVRRNAFSQLQRQMKALYEDSILEESIGNIEAAKEKWMKIVDSSIPEDDYYKKAKSKLKRYGIGI